MRERAKDRQPGPQARLGGSVAARDFLRLPRYSPRDATGESPSSLESESGQFREACMHRGRKRVGPDIIVLLLCLLGVFQVSPAAVSAEETVVELNSPDVVRQLLEQQAGKRVKIKLLSGQDVDGKVAKVGTQAVTLSELSGMELFDATIRLDQVAAVIVRRAK